MCGWLVGWLVGWLDDGVALLFIFSGVLCLLVLLLLPSFTIIYFSLVFISLPKIKIQYNSINV
jgi:hypothetical protein